MSDEERRQFFTQLAGRAGRFVPPRARGVVRIELHAGPDIECWTVTMRGAEVSATREPVVADPDAEMMLSAALFDRLVRGESSALSAALRNEITFAGDLELLRVFSRFFPSPSGAVDPRSAHRRPPATAGSSQWEALGGTDQHP